MSDKNWKAIAEASSFGIPESELERVAAALNALEAAFRPLAKDLPPDLEPTTGVIGGEESA
jgi:hypothetical protein